VSETVGIVDAHQHFWDLARNPYPWLQDSKPIAFRYGDYSALRRNYLPDDFRRDTQGLGIVGTVHVEAEWDRATPEAETDWLAALARTENLPSACVAHAALDRADAAEVLAAQAARPMVRGIRHKPASAASAGEARRGVQGSMDDESWRRGYALLGRHGLSFDLQTPWWHLDAAASLAHDFPATTIIINHTGLPSDRSAEGLAGWRAALAGVAECANVALKISGLGLAAKRWSAADNIPVIRDAITIFGWHRCLFASNYPVDSLVGGYAEILAGFCAAIADRPHAEQRALLYDNAVRFYRL
jgi:predicted TIM-barrel fold metal-dependent hydrolase